MAGQPGLSIPEEFAATIVSLHGSRGRRWLEGLDARVRAIEARWGIEVTGVLPGLSYNLIVSAKGAGHEAYVLKLGVPSREISTEIRALRAYGGRGAVCLRRSNARVGALLLDRVEPGMSLATLEDEEMALRIFVDVFRALRRAAPPPGRLPRVADWAAGMERLRAAMQDGLRFPASLSEGADRLFRELLESTPEESLLHGDLHQMNILRSHSRWVAIDPKGVVGDRCYDTVPFLLNCLPDALPEAVALIDRRIGFLARELHLDGRRIRAWLRAHAVLSAWWMAENGVGGLARALSLAEALWAG